MVIKHSNIENEYGPGVDIELTGDEVAVAIGAYLVAHRVHINGPHTIRVNGELCRSGNIYVDPMGHVLHEGIDYSGRGVNDIDKLRERIAVLDIKKEHIGSSLDDLLKEDGIYEDVVVAATKKALAFKLEQLMREQQITKTELAKPMEG